MLLHLLLDIRRKSRDMVHCFPTLIYRTQRIPAACHSREDVIDVFFVLLIVNVGQASLSRTDSVQDYFSLDNKSLLTRSEDHLHSVSRYDSVCAWSDICQHDIAHGQENGE